MLIDFHTHFFPDNFFRAIWRWFEAHAWPIHYKSYADDLVGILKNEGVTKAISLHYPHKPGMANLLNKYAFDLAQKYPDFLIPFGSVHPDDVEIDKILKICFEKYGFKGIKIHCHVQKAAPDDPRMEPIYKVCNGYKKILLIHCGTGPHFKDQPTRGYGYDVSTVSGVGAFENIISKYPQITFVVPHLGYEEVEDFFSLLPRYPNLYLDTTMALANFLPVEVKKEWLVDNADRLLFGSDFPNIPYEWSRERDNIFKMKLGREVEEKIFWRNAVRILGLKNDCGK